jgi:hypothetical protein
MSQAFFMNKIARKFKKNGSEFENAIQLQLPVPAAGRSNVYMQLLAC